jgi:hypothetical protein
MRLSSLPNRQTSRDTTHARQTISAAQNRSASSVTMATARHRVTGLLFDRGTIVVASRVLLAGGGASGVHARSAFVREDACFVAVGPFVCALEVPSLRLLWHARADTATCFGVYDSPTYANIISHGEIEIACLSYSGQVLWSTSGRDIFSGSFRASRAL